MTPNWPPRDYRAMFALVASVAGAAVLTAMLAYIVLAFERWKEVAPLAQISLGLLFIIGIVLIGLGTAINRRTAKGNIGSAGFEISGGESDQPAATVTTQTTVETKP